MLESRLFRFLNLGTDQPGFGDVLKRIFDQSKITEYSTDYKRDEVYFKTENQDRTERSLRLHRADGQNIITVDQGVQFSVNKKTSIETGMEGVTIPSLVLMNFIDRLAQKENIQSFMEKAIAFDEKYPYLFTPEHIAYCLAWKEKINPNSDDYSVFYPGIGHDFTSALLTTNATKITGVNNTYLNPSFFKGFMETDNPVIDAVIKGFEWRQKAGFMKYDFIPIMGLEYFIFAELKMLGVDIKTVKFEFDKNCLNLKFDWAFPGEEPKEREINLFTSQVFVGNFQADERLNQNYDCYYIKCPGADGNDFLAEYLDCTGFTEHLNPGGVVLTSPPHGNDPLDWDLYINVICPEIQRKIRGEGINVDLDMDRFMMEHKFTQDSSQMFGYGCRLLGAKKSLD